jgi:hypothetical protein
LAISIRTLRREKLREEGEISEKFPDISSNDKDFAGYYLIWTRRNYLLG